MALLIETFEDLVHIIETNPEWRRRLKRSLFDIDIEAALTRLEAAIEELVTIQRQQANDISGIKGDVSELKSDVSELKSDVSELKSDVSDLKSGMTRLNGRVARMATDVATVKGKSYEHDYRLKASAIFGRFIRRGRDRTDDVADQLYDALAAGTISAQELTQILSADLLWGGRARLNEEEVVVILKASWRAESNDVERAHQRATTLRRIGFYAVPVVAGMEWEQQARALADSLAVAIAANGQVDADSWQKALMAPHALPE
ncbi:MAG: hypothetical protein DCC55_21395 [Chloroflexi bacterium]|nr:MAG: hypothetical protein DCC55_21395 [Chloroflexota bacterium]